MPVTEKHVFTTSPESYFEVDHMPVATQEAFTSVVRKTIETYDDVQYVSFGGGAGWQNLDERLTKKLEPSLPQCKLAGACAMQTEVIVDARGYKGLLHLSCPLQEFAERADASEYAASCEKNHQDSSAAFGDHLRGTAMALEDQTAELQAAERQAADARAAIRDLI
ncbi:MAG: hypothetical protein JWN38_522 [Candidatus Saccharibacteria bacterium]|nr:hypothetical protein [Candidatus Saccharibacteria bacterium]